MAQKIHKLDDLNLIRPEILFAMYSGKRMTNKGLKGRRLGPGRYRFCRLDHLPMASTVAVFVQLAEPWASERTSVAVLLCLAHGLFCPPDEIGGMTGEVCKKRHGLVEASRWMAVIVRRGSQSFDVEILRYPKVKTVAAALRGKPIRKDAGFTVQYIPVKGW